MEEVPAFETINVGQGLASCGKLVVFVPAIRHAKERLAEVGPAKATASATQATVPGWGSTGFARGHRQLRGKLVVEDPASRISSVSRIIAPDLPIL